MNQFVLAGERRISMKRIGLLIFGCLCLALLFGTRVHPQRRKQPPQKPVAKKETIAEKIVLEGICRSPSPSAWETAANINIANSLRSEPTLVRLPDVLVRLELLFHILSAADLKYLYETRSYKTEIFPNTYKKNEAGLKTLLAKVEDYKKERGSVSSSDRYALYPVIKAYFIDASLTIQEIPKSSMRGNFAEAYKENEKAIAELAKSRPEEGLNPYADKETPLVKVMIAYLIDFAILVRDAYQSTSSGNLAIAYEKNRAKIGSLAAKNWKSDQLGGEERDALRNVLEASAIDVASLLREAYKTSNKGSFGEIYAKNATAVESLSSKNLEKDSPSAFPALCQVLTAYQGPR